MIYIAFILIISGFMLLIIDKKSKENSVLFNNQEKMLKTCMQETHKRLKTEDEVKIIRNQMIKYKEELLDIEIHKIIDEQMNMIEDFSSMPFKHIFSNKDKIFKMVEILENKKNNIVKEMCDLEVVTPKPLIIEDVNFVSYITPKEYINKFTSFSFSSILNKIGIPETEDERKRREAKGFFNDILKDPKVVDKYSNVVIENKSKH